MTERRITPAEPVTQPDAPIELLIPSMLNPRPETPLDDSFTENVRAMGVLEPLIVRAHPTKTGHFEVIAGLRRLAAAKAAGLSHVPIAVRTLTDAEAREVAMVENLHRRDMNPIEEANGYLALVNNAVGKKPGQTRGLASVAAAVGVSEGHVFRTMRFLKLEAPLQAALAEGRLSTAHAVKLLALTPALRKEATDLNTGVVWKRNPLLDGDDHKPTADDLRPLHELTQFVRSKAVINLADEATPFLQPQLIEHGAVAGAVDAPTPAAALASLIAVSEDQLVRMRLGGKDATNVPLSPSKWREVGKKRCDHTVGAVVTHGGPPRVLDVCITKGCPIHFPPPKAAKLSPSAAKNQEREAAQRKREDARRKRENDKREAEQKAWEQAAPDMAATIVAGLSKLKFSAGLVQQVLDAYVLTRIHKTFGVKLTDKTAALVMALSTIDMYNLDRATRTWKPYRLDAAKAFAAWRKAHPVTDTPDAAEQDE